MKYEFDTEIYRQILEKILDGVCLIQDWKIVYANPALCRITGRPLEELIGQKFSGFIYEDDREMTAERYYQRMTSDHVPNEYEVRVLHRDGSTAYTRLNSNLISWNNRPAALVSITDITEKRNASHALQESEKQYRDLIYFLNDGVIITQDSHVKVANEAIARLLGHPVEEIIGSNFFRYIIPEDHERVKKIHMDRMHGKDVPLEYDVSLQRADGSIITVRLNTTTIKWEGKLSGLATISDVTERVKTQEQLIREKDRAEEVSRAKEEFLANMSHEIRTPLNAVVGFSELMQDTPLNPEQDSYLYSIQENAKLLLSLIDDILHFSKIESCKIVPEIAPVDLHRFLHDTVQMFQTESGASNRANIVLSIDPQLPQYIHTDPLRLKQIIVNLISNAVKFSHQAEVKIDATMTDRQGSLVSLVIAVKDTGIGIPAEKMDRLFQVFSQVDPSTSKHFGGTGLGLAICKRLVELLGGRITVKSRPGEGSTFSLSLTTDTTPPDREPLPPPTIEPQRKLPENLSILVVDDHLDNSILTTRQLQKLGFECDIAYNGLEAIEQASRTRYDLIFMDLQMPGMDGYDTTGKIRETENGKPSVIIALTANAMPSDREAAMKCGMDDYLCKPVKLDALRTIIEIHFS